MTNICVICGSASAHEIERTREISNGGHRYSILNDKIMHCDSCGEMYYTGAQAKSSDRAFADARRRSEKLLTSEEIRLIRHSLALTQDQLESALGVGAKTVVRWENGTAVQSKALDNVLRLIALDPDNLRLLVRLRRAAIAPQIEARITPEDRKKTGELQAAIFAGLESSRVPASDVQFITDAVLAALKNYKEEKINRATAARLVAVG